MPPPAPARCGRLTTLPDAPLPWPHVACPAAQARRATPPWLISNASSRAATDYDDSISHVGAEARTSDRAVAGQPPMDGVDEIVPLPFTDIDALLDRVQSYPPALAH
ncbi:MAG: hypothetical protein AVDCRST_MAG77-6209 [uncultured Chloroflexi bacterium]|uniref:Uncharacterized protein n=1 Tax=uncultured Chloroflexota bacterium TaxID=166587 RepID=A0A6J4KJ08_9CHLR|nr:MAG: hypothetical protein AVDCRST_MAG77-6209 [uncultured Chloroflexota bacterium]